jgi:hypothetical protein
MLVGSAQRQMLQAGKPGRQTPTEGDPPAALALQRTGSPTKIALLIVVQDLSW